MKFRNPAASPGALAPAALGLSILLYALGGMLSWIARARDFLPTAIGPTAVFGAAPCFALVGLAVALNRPDSRRMIAAQQALGAAVVLIAGLVAGPAWLDYGLGITWRGLDRWYDDNPYHPARMSLMTSTAFVVCGAVLALMHRVRNRGTGLMVQALTLAVAAVATAGLVGEALDLRFVYANYLFDRMAANTAAGLIVSSIALWLCWRWTSWHRQRTGSRNEGTRIRLAGAATVGATVAVSVIAGFNVAQREVEARVSDGLLRALNSRATLFRTDVEDRLVRAQLVAGRPDAASHLQALNARPNDAAALRQLKALAEGFLPLGFSAVAFYSPAGREWLRVGRPARQPEWSFELNRARTARLLWERELLLDARLPVRSEGGVVGAVIVEQPVRVLTALYGTVSEFGETGEVGVCAVRDAAIQCLPQRRTPRAVNAEYAGLPPMTQALAGRTGTMRTRDYRGRQVIAAFGPVGDLGLGMIEKMDTVELYAPLRTAFHGALLLLCALTGGGAALLYWRLKPLVGALERSRERVRAEGEQALQTSEERYRYLFEVSPMPMWVRDLDRHRLLAVNDAAVQMYGYTREEFLSMTTLDLRAPDDIAAYRSRIGAWDETAESLHGVDRHRRKDGTEMRVEATSRLIEFDGRPARLVLLSDVTERLRSEEQVRQLNAELEQRVAERTRLLEAANQELEGFSYSVSHDLRAPLRAVIGFSRLLVEDHAQQLDEEARRKLEVIRSEAQRMGELIDDLLAFSRLGRKAMQMSDLDMTELARTAFQGLNGQQAGARADFRLAELPRARGDRVLLGQVWANLLSNALKFSSKRDRPVIEVGATTDERGHVYFVRDNGAGFDPRYQSKLFGVFERLHSTDEFPGTGVGLALVARIVLRHGGRVWAEGKPGEGATFYFTLPREPHNEPV